MFRFICFVLLPGAAAFAQEAGEAAAKGPSTLESLIIPLLGFGFIFYFLILRPQARTARDTQDFLSKLKKGDEVLTTGGILGTIVGVTDNFVDLRVSDGMKLKVVKSHVAQYFAAAQNKQVKNKKVETN